MDSPSAPKSVAEYKNFLSIARGSLVESEAQMELARRFGYITAEQLQPIADLQAEIGKMLWAMMQKV